MKKFIAVSAVFFVSIIAIFIGLSCIHPQSNLIYTGSDTINIYAKSTTAKKTYNKDSKGYNTVVEYIGDALKISTFTHLFNGTTDPRLTQDVGNLAEYSANSVLTKNYAISLQFSTEQKQVVYEDGNEHVITHYGYIIIINPDKDYQLVQLYFKPYTYSNYKAEPMLAYINAKEVIQYIDSLK